MKALVLLCSLLGALVADGRLDWKPWATEQRLKMRLSESADVFSRYLSEATPETWLNFVNRLTPGATIRLSLFGEEIQLEGQAEIAKVIRDHHALLNGLEVKASNAVVESEAGRMATVLVQTMIVAESRGIAEPAMLRLGLIRVEHQWLIHHVKTVQGYMPLI
tara:strand:+ start:951 stop:1439 length:489 start_codon:yes stop_codon:yes gene_type:complete